MTVIAYGNSAASAISLTDRLVARVASVRSDWSNWRTYRTTFNELSALSNRDLADLGMSRSMIRAVALEAAYGK